MLLCTMWQILFIILFLAGFSPASGLAANSAGNFGGVGIDGAPLADGQIVVRQLVAGGPAHLSGIRAGDVITHIDGKQTRGSDFKRMVETRLRGRAGTRVLSRRPSGLRKTRSDVNSLAHRTTWLRSDFPHRR